MKQKPAFAVARELKEKTGLNLEMITDIWTESYSAVGISNEKGIVIVGVADGVIRESSSDVEKNKAA